VVLDKLGGAGAARFGDAAEILDTLVLNDDFIAFLTLPAYAYLDQGGVAGRAGA
jgi:hypothetical protein